MTPKPPTAAAIADRRKADADADRAELRRIVHTYPRRRRMWLATIRLDDDPQRWPFRGSGRSRAAAIARARAAVARYRAFHAAERRGASIRESSAAMDSAEAAALAAQEPAR